MQADETLYCGFSRGLVDAVDFSDKMIDIFRDTFILHTSYLNKSIINFKNIDINSRIYDLER